VTGPTGAQGSGEGAQGPSGTARGADAGDGGRLERCRRLLPALWLGVLLALALIAAPAAFATWQPPHAGRIVGRILAQEAVLSLAFAVGLLLLERRRARQLADRGAASVLSAEMVLLLGTIFCTVAGHHGLEPLIAQARTGRGVLSFGQLHAVSVAFYGVKTVLVAALAWRAAAANR
jgi:hypothetical protein